MVGDAKLIKALDILEENNTRSTSRELESAFDGHFSFVVGDQETRRMGK